MPQVDKIILHWLNNSRAQRIVWLLEELNLKYDIKIYKRINGRAPETAKKIHPLGKFPIIEIVKPNGKIIKLAETGHLISYLLKFYDTDNKLSGKNDDEKEQVDYFLHFSEGTLQNLYVYLFITYSIRQKLPYGISYLISKVLSLPGIYYYKPEIHLNLSFLQDTLKKNSSKYFVGDSLTAADIILSFPVYDNTFAKPKVSAELFQENDLLEKYSVLKNWGDNISKLPNYVKAEQITEKAMKEFDEAQKD